MEDHRCVILFLKAPVKGTVKSRLAASIGEDAALGLYRCFVKDTLEMLVRGGYRLVIYFSPAGARQRIVRWLGGRQSLLPQTGADLGERMKNAFRTVFAKGFCSALIIGSDSPDLPGRVLDEALASLDDHDAVLGPTEDGGYYLIGFRRDAFLSRAFDGIPWSTPAVFAQTLDLLTKAGLRVHLAPPWRDIDTVEDLKALVLKNRNAPFAKSATMTYIEKQWSDDERF